MLDIEIDQVKDLTLGVVSAQGIQIGPANSALRQACDEITQRVSESGMTGGEPRREAVRRMLRAGGFKPAGRNKPAQEYLLRTALESGGLSPILNAVDWLNAVSLESGLPISLLSAQRLGEQAIARYGQPNETFVFNRAGQELSLDGLICICAAQGEGSEPLGTPIKDSMAGKISEQDADVVTFLYGPSGSIDDEELAMWCEKLGKGYREYCGARSFETKAIRGNA